MLVSVLCWVVHDRALALNNNALSGSIPDEVSSLSALTYVLNFFLP
jgi:hypothetical protein